MYTSTFASVHPTIAPSIGLQVNVGNIFLLFKKSIKDTAGKLEIKVDGNNVITVDTFFGKGWGDYSATQVLVEKSLNKKHEIEIRVINEDKPVEVNIMGFLVS